MPRSDPRTSQRLMWERIEGDISDHGGWIISPAGQFPIRYECQPDNELPRLLRQAGYSVVSIGSAERFLPVSEFVKINAFTTVERQHHAPAMVEVWELRLPETGR